MSYTSDEETKISIKTQSFVCQNCGGTLKYNINTKKFQCVSCKTEADIETVSESVKEYDFSEYAKREAESIPFEGLAVAHCRTCGAEITFSEKQFSATCPMCGSTQIAEDKQRSGIPPEGIIPFSIDKNDAAQKFKNWVKSRWFAPNDFKRSYAEAGLVPMYLPFWTFDAECVGKYAGMGGKVRMVRDSKGNMQRHVDWYPVAGVVYKNFDDIQVSASDKSKHLDGILPFNTIENTKAFSMAYLSGYFAEIYKIKADQGFGKAKGIIDSQMRALAMSDILMRFEEANVTSIHVTHSNVTYKHLLLPVYTSAFRYKSKTYSYAINGETGRISGNRPYSAPKIIAAVIAAIIVVVLLTTYFNEQEEYYNFNQNYEIVYTEFDNNIM